MERISLNSLLYWFPKVFLSGVPVPQTVWYEASSDKWLNLLDGEVGWWEERKKGILDLARSIGFPLFMRTDILSGKHNWRETCFVADEEHLFDNIRRLAEESYIGFGMEEPSALVFREYIPLEASFTAFKGLPIAKERRYFVKDGVVECHHFYWPVDAIRNPSIPAWRTWLKELNKEDGQEIETLSGYASKVGQRLSGHWSVDFAKAKDGRWLLIDMAEAERSWHPAHK